MDARSQRLLNAIDDYVNDPPQRVPEPLMEHLNSMRDMVEAPRYSEESPGEEVTRRVAQETMPPEVYNERYGDEQFTPENMGV